MQSWINLACYQLAWLVSVSGAGRGSTWPALAAASLLCSGHFIASSHRGVDLRLMGLAAVLGIFIDGFMASTGLLRYSPATPAVPVSGCPLWILAMWIAFSTTLTRSLGWLRGRTGWALLFGGLGGPLAYGAAGGGRGVITFGSPQGRSLLALATGWAIALAVLVRAAGRSALQPANSTSTQEEPDFP